MEAEANKQKINTQQKQRKLTTPPPRQSVLRENKTRTKRNYNETSQPCNVPLGWVKTSQEMPEWWPMWILCFNGSATGHTHLKRTSMQSLAVILKQTHVYKFMYKDAWMSERSVYSNDGWMLQNKRLTLTCFWQHWENPKCMWITLYLLLRQVRFTVDGSDFLLLCLCDVFRAALIH